MRRFRVGSGAAGGRYRAGLSHLWASDSAQPARIGAPFKEDYARSGHEPGLIASCGFCWLVDFSEPGLQPPESSNC